MPVTAAPDTQKSDVDMATVASFDSFGPALAGGAAARPRKFYSARHDVRLSLMEGMELPLTLDFPWAEAFEWDGGPDGTFAHSGKLLGNAPIARCV